MELKLENGYFLDNEVLFLDLRFSGLGEVQREEGIVIRNRESFLNLSLEGIPLTLEHPKNDDDKNVLINDDDSNYWIIGSILKEIDTNNKNEIRVIARIYDKTFINLFLTNKENIFNLLSTSPAVQSQLIKIEDEKYFEIVSKIDHLALLIESVGFWDSYITEPAVNENSNKEITLDEIKIDESNNILIKEIGDFNMELEKEITSSTLDAVETKETLEKDTLELIEEIIEDIKESKDGDLKEEIKEEVEKENIIDEIEGIEEIKDKEEVIDDDIITEDFETEDDKEREFLVTIASNLVDSLEDFRKPVYNKRVKPEIYLRKLLSLNKAFVDSKYHSVLDSVSLDLGKEILSSIAVKKQNKQELSNAYWLEFGNKRVRKF